MNSNLGILRDIKDNDLELMLSWRNHPSIRTNMYTQNEIHLDEHLSWWEKTKEQKSNKYLIYTNDRAPLGIVYFNKIDTINKNVKWGFYASPNAKRGTGSKMEYLALEYAFNELKTHKIYCEVLSYNSSVIKLHLKYGFTVEGTFREHFFLNSEFIDIVRLGLLKKEWSDTRGSIYEKISRY